MKKPNEDKLTEYILAGLGVIPIVWAALMVAPFLSEGLALWRVLRPACAIP